MTRKIQAVELRASSKTSVSHPYIGLKRKAFWKSAVSEKNPLEFEDIYTPRFLIDKRNSICAAGSCFAQHIGRQFKARGYNFLDREKPVGAMSPSDMESFGLDMYSARYGNIYSIRQLAQLFGQADGSFVSEESAWEKEGRFYDPFRPSIQPNGFDSIEELKSDRAYHLQQVNLLLERTSVFVFTFGLTESWVNTVDGTVLPTCPGTIAGVYDDEKYKFKNFTHAEVLGDAEKFIAYAIEKNPKIRFLFTVSPVPLTATASGNHVLPATVYSKSVLRSVCGELYDKYSNVDYFPSYELITSHPTRGMFFEPNLRAVSRMGVRHVMDVFFSAIRSGPNDTSDLDEESLQQKHWVEEESVACDELILEEFGE